MRRTPYLLLATLLLLSATTNSCSREDDPEEQKDDKKVEDWQNEDINGNATMNSAPMLFNVTSVHSVPPPEVTTRGSVGTLLTDHYAFDVNDLVTISITGKGKKVYQITEVKTDATTHVSTGTLEYTGTPPDAFQWNNTNEDIDVTAWSYGSKTEMGNNPSGHEFYLETNQKVNGYEELLYMSETQMSYGTEGKISLSLEHMLARVVITINQDAATPKTIGDVTMGDSEGDKVLPTAATFTPSNPKKWTDFGSQKGVVYPKVEPTSPNVFSAVLIPTTYKAGLKFINITIGEEEFSYLLPSDVELLAGKQYNYTITVKNKEIEVTSQVYPWGTTASPSTLNSTGIMQYPLALEYLATGNIKSHNKNAQGQWVIDIENGVNSSAYFNWNTASGYFSNRSVECSDGNMYHWGTVGEWKSLIPSIPKPSASLDYLDTWAGSKTETDIAIGGRSGLTFDSYWIRVSSTLSLAIRYISSTYIGYCSAWKYETNATNFVIKAKRLNIPITSVSQVTNESGPLWTLIKSDSFWSSNVVSRTLPYCRLYTSGDGEAGSQNYQTNCGLYLCAERFDETYYYECLVGDGIRTAIWSSNYGFVDAGRSVRLFRDIID